MELRLGTRPPFSLPAVIGSHGWVRLAPFDTDLHRSTLTTVNRLSSGQVVELVIQQADDGVRVEVDGALSEGEQAEVRDEVGWMVEGLVSEFGAPLAADPARHAFPTPEQLAAADEGALRSGAGLGYRAP